MNFKDKNSGLISALFVLLLNDAYQRAEIKNEKKKERWNKILIS
jgi:hypothetical protein